MMEFVKNRGNGKEMETEPGVSYWTIRSKLDRVITHLGFEDPEVRAEERAKNRRLILEKLERGELAVAEASDLLAGL